MKKEGDQVYAVCENCRALSLCTWMLGSVYLPISGRYIDDTMIAYCDTCDAEVGWEGINHEGS